jgi:2-methylcitrate dehydratase PrpD
MPYLVGAMLVHGRLTPAEFTQSRLTDPAIYTIADMVELVANRSYDEIYNSTHNRLCADLTVRLQAGSRLSGRVEFAKGEAVNPMSDADLVQKFMANCHVAKRTGDATEIADTIMRIDLLPSVAELGTLLRQPS